MNKDTVEGKAKDIAGRVERQVGEWTDDPNLQVKGAAKQAEGKAQNAWGKTKDAVDDAAKKPSTNQADANDQAEKEEESRHPARAVNE